MKSCSKCGEEKPLDGFYDNGNGTLRSNCKSCHMEDTRKRYLLKRDQYRNHRLQKAFGITADEYDELLASQGHVCAICARPPDPKKNAFPVDHCHAEGHVRGILCHQCNKGIGLLQDSPEVTDRATRYLLASRGK